MTALNTPCSRYFTFEAVFHCGDSWQRSQCQNEPCQQASWDAYAMLATQILDPIYEGFGAPKLTFGFCGPHLRRQILNLAKPGIAPKLDQHASHELNSKGLPVCNRLGAAIDLFIPGLPSQVLALWVGRNLPFDRLYYYGEHRPIHISIGPDHSRQISLLNTKDGKRIPKRINLETLIQLTEGSQRMSQ